MDYKGRIKKATEGFIAREEKPKVASRKNKKPEKEVEKLVILWCRQKRFDVDVVESKAVFSVASGRYTGRAASHGMSDIIGTTPQGLFVAIELKAPGKRVGSSLREEQRFFLSRKIQTGAFAVVADSIEYLEKTWTHFCTLSFEDRIVYLMNELPSHNPRQLKISQSPGTDDDFPW